MKIIIKKGSTWDIKFKPVRFISDSIHSVPGDIPEEICKIMIKNGYAEEIIEHKTKETIIEENKSLSPVAEVKKKKRGRKPKAK